MERRTGGRKGVLEWVEIDEKEVRRKWRRKWRGRSLEGEVEEKKKWGTKRERDGEERKSSRGKKE